MTDTAALAAIGAATRELRLPVVRADAGRLADDRRSDPSSPTSRSSPRSSPPRSTNAANGAASGASTKPASPASNASPTSTSPPRPTINPATIATLAAGAYLDAGEPVVLLGDSGTGKSHLLIGLGVAACEQGRRVRYATAAQLVNELAEAADERRLSRLVARYGRLDLLCLDELGYVQLDSRGAELLFQILTEREEKASIAVASNLPFSEWGQVIADPRLVAAIVDRVTFNAHIIETGTDSYRLRTTKAARARNKTA